MSNVNQYAQTDDFDLAVDCYQVSFSIESSLRSLQFMRTIIDIYLLSDNHPHLLSTNKIKASSEKRR